MQRSRRDASPGTKELRNSRVMVAGVLALVLQQPVHAFDLQGHRGARGLAPESTLAAFRVALAIGVTTLETDLGLTADGVLILAQRIRRSNALHRLQQRAA